jgi:hypothetical protein
MVSDIIHIYDLSIDVQFGNMFYCSILIMVQGEYSGVLVPLELNNGRFKIKNQSKLWRVGCILLHFPCDVGEKEVCNGY